MGQITQREALFVLKRKRERERERAQSGRVNEPTNQPANERFVLACCLWKSSFFLVCFRSREKEKEQKREKKKKKEKEVSMMGYKAVKGKAVVSSHSFAKAKGVRAHRSTTKTAARTTLRPSYLPERLQRGSSVVIQAQM